MLDGNLFQCNASSVPVQDPHAEDYVCGSSNMNIALVVWLCVSLVALAGVCCGTWRCVCEAVAGRVYAEDIHSAYDGHTGR